MLDNIPNSHRKRQHRIYSRLLSGHDIARKNRIPMYFLTLTSSEDSPKIYKKREKTLRIFKNGCLTAVPIYRDSSGLMHSFDLLKKTLYRAYGKFEYCGIRTSEGCGVLHLLFRSKRRLNINLIRQLWLKYHSAVQMKICRVYNYSRRLINYLAVYLKNQDQLQSLFSSRYWIAPQFRTLMVSYIKAYGYKHGIKLYTRHILVLHTTQTELNLKKCQTILVRLKPMIPTPQLDSPQI